MLQDGGQETWSYVDFLANDATKEPDNTRLEHRRNQANHDLDNPMKNLVNLLSICIIIVLISIQIKIVKQRKLLILIFVIKIQNS